jgi:predicted RecB family nuclease
MLMELTKTDFNAGTQCEKRLYLSHHQPELADPVVPGANRRLEDGIEIGILGRQYYPGGTLIDLASGAPEIETAKAIASGVECIYEATFQVPHPGIFVRTDILRWLPDSQTWHLIEVKSATSAKPEYVADAAFQLQAARASGLDVHRVSILHINNQYVYPGGEYDPKLAFTEVDVTSKVEELLPSITEAIAKFQGVLNSSAVPNVATNRHCADPPCPFHDHCHSDQPKHDVIFLPRISAKQVEVFRQAGFSTIDSLPEAEVKPQWKTIWSVVRSGQPFFNDALATELSSLPYPIHFIDFESVASGLPVYPHSRPYQQIPFQWSNHIVEKPGETPKHEEFLQLENTDPRAPFAETLWQSIRDAGTVVVYSSFEISRLKDLDAEGIPYGQELVSKLTSTGFDLLKSVKDHVYHPQFNGSFSVKKVLPALVPELSYDNLPIHDGDTASLRFLEMQGFRPTPQTPHEIAANLLEYCSLDTLAMVKIFDCLQTASGNGNRSAVNAH